MISRTPGTSRPTWRSATWALVVGVGTLIAAITNFVLPDDNPALDWLFLGCLLISCLMMLVGIRMWSPPPSVARGWRLIALGMAMYLAGETVWTWYSRHDRDPFPSIADALYIGGVLVMIIGSISLVAARRDHTDRAVQLDTAIVAIAVGSVLWTLTIEPYATESSASLLEHTIAGTYPMFDVVLAATIARLLLAGGRLPSGFVLLLAGIGVWTLVDIAYYQQELSGTYAEWGWIDFGYMVGFLLIGASSIHPGAARVADFPEQPTHLGRGRTAVLAMFAAAPLALIAVDAPLGLGVNDTVLSVAGAVLIALVTVRTWSLIVVNRELGELRGHARFTSMIRNSTDAIVIVDETRTIAYTSPSLANHWGWSERSLTGCHLEQLIAEKSRPGVLRWLDELCDGRGDRSLEADWLDADGDTLSVSMVASDLREDAEIGGIVLTGRDVSHRVELERQLKHDASHDVLTGLVNRAAFTAELDRDLTRGHAGAHAVAFVDVDDFKDINDALGHDIGDTVLVEIAERLVSCVRPGDVVARLGGDEFGILLRSATVQSADATAARLVGSATAPIRLGANMLNVSVSVGYHRLAGELSAADALRSADLAMYDAKRSGKSRAAVYSPEMLDHAAQRLSIRSHLATAVEDDALHLVYQNVVRIEDGVVTGREALLRWQPSGSVPISPVDFIPIAEETGDIVAIGEWVLRRACHDAMEWTPNADGVCPLVSVNVSAVQLEHDFANIVARVLATSGLPTDRLQLELTESLMAEPSSAQAVQDLNELGVRLAIDDFGTGYCSLAYLQQFDVDVIKIDRRLVDGCSKDRRLISGIAGLINAVGATAVAEGVECAEDRDALLDLAVPLGQGFLWHQPSGHREHRSWAAPSGVRRSVSRS